MFQSFKLPVKLIKSTLNENTIDTKAHYQKLLLHIILIKANLLYRMFMLRQFFNNFIIFSFIKNADFVINIRISKEFFFKNC